MAKNSPPGDRHRVGAVKCHPQTQTPSDAWVKRDTATGHFMDVKTSSSTSLEGVRREKKGG